jgi:hypothetical protein
MLLVLAPFVGVARSGNPAAARADRPAPVARPVGDRDPHRIIRPDAAGFQLFMQMLVFPMIFLAGVFFPVDVPTWMQVLSKLNPATYGVDAIRQVFLGSGPGRRRLGVSVWATMSLVERSRSSASSASPSSVPRYGASAVE